MTTTPPDDPAQRDRGRIWVVDDSPLEREAVARAMTPAFAVEIFTDGATLLEALSQRPVPDLLLVDWHMPDLSGRDVCTFVRSRASASQLPILVLTGSDDALVEALGAGANDYVTKPFRPHELNARAGTLVALSRAHAKVVKAKEEHEIEAAFRERFIGILAHDLRQPIGTVTMALSLLDRQSSPETRDVTSRARRATLRMTRMIDELLDLTRSRAGGMPVTPVASDLTDLVRRVVADHASQERITFEATGVTRGLWDADRIAQVCSNLIGNALEHGQGQCPILVRVVGSAAEVVLEVHNDGVPIPSSELSTLFDPFRRGAASASAGRKPGVRHVGVGLGLYIVDQIVRAHGGGISVRSGDDGTTFVVRMPRVAA